MVERYVRVLRMHLADDVLPELEGLEHVGLVDAGQPLAALSRGLERDMRDAFDLGARVAHGVEGFVAALESAVGRLAAPARLAEIDVAGQLANDQQIEAGDQLGLQARRMRQLGIADRRTQVGEQPELLAQARIACSGRRARSSWSYFQSPTAPNSTASAAWASCKRRFGQRMAVRFVGRAADRRGLDLQRQVERAEHASASATISGPMPSPGRTAIFIVSAPPRYAPPATHETLTGCGGLRSARCGRWVLAC